MRRMMVCFCAFGSGIIELSRYAYRNESTLASCVLSLLRNDKFRAPMDSSPIGALKLVAVHCMEPA